MGRADSPGGFLNTDLELSYVFLKKAESGYKKELMNGSEMYEKSYEEVLKLLGEPQFKDFSIDYKGEKNGYQL